MRHTPFVVLAMTALAAVAERPAYAVVDIRFERWSLPSGIQRDVVAPVDSVSEIGVDFDATASAGDQDPMHGLRFAIAERDPGDNDVLVRFEAAEVHGPQPCVALVPIGTAVAISASFSVYCDASGELRVRDGVVWSASWCDLPQQHHCASFGEQPAAALPETSEPERWEFVALGDGDVEGSFPTPEDVVGCGGPQFPINQYVAPEFAANGSLGIFADPTGTVCSDRIVPFQPFRWYLVASLDGMTRCGLTLVEFGIPLPSGFFINAIQNPHAGAPLGSPFGQGAIFFPSCERGDGERIVLYTLEGVATSEVNDLALTVGAAMPPSNVFWPYPWAHLCPDVNAPRRRMRTSTFYINPSPQHDCGLPVPVMRRSWSAVKSLYRD